MSLKTEVYGSGGYAGEAASFIERHLPEQGSVILTGGSTAARIYPLLADIEHDWSHLEVGFSDERCVPPEDDASNYKMAGESLLWKVDPFTVLRMPGESDPREGARSYHEAIAPLAEPGFDLLLLGMGADAHVGALYPDSPALAEEAAFCRAVDRPDGMKGLTLTPPAMLGAKKIILLVTGESKADAVRRVIQGSESPNECPARILAAHPDVTFLLDTEAASAL
jgi:6-phosphogluconolactonase